MSKLILEEIKVRLDTFERRFNELDKQYASIQKTLDNIYNDRDLLSELHNSLDDIKKMIISSERHTDQASEGVKNKVASEVKDVKVVVTQGTQEIKAGTEEVKQEVPTQVVTQIEQSFKRKKTTLLKKSILNRLTKFLTFGRVRL